MTLERLLSRAVKQPNGCLTIGCPSTPTLYWPVRVGGVVMGAHRFVWESKHGAIADGMQVCHKCDNPRCINIDHLYLGTQKDNVADMLAKVRSRPANSKQHPAGGRRPVNLTLSEEACAMGAELVARHHRRSLSNLVEHLLAEAHQAAKQEAA